MGSIFNIFIHPRQVIDDTFNLLKSGLFTLKELFDADITLFTLVRLTITGNIVAGKNNGGYKYGGIAEKPPNLTRHN